MKRSYAVIAFIALAEVAAAQTVPLPRPRPFLHSDEAAPAGSCNAHAVGVPLTTDSRTRDRTFRQ